MNKALIYDWNRDTPVEPPPIVMLDDETLRDGLQSPSVRAPSIDQKLRILRLLDELGVDTADIGLPGAGPHVVRDVERLAREIVESKLKIKANCAARTVVGDVQPIVEVSQRVGVGIDWHGHRDRDMDTINSLAALEAGASRIHGTILGIGERVGNTPMDMLLVNLVLMGWIRRDLTKLDDLVRAVSEATGEPIPDNYPVFGRDAFRTATGVHAAAVVKAFRKNDPELMDSVYSGVPAHMVGRAQQIEVGPLSGKSNVVFWLEQHGFTPDEHVVDRVFRRAKSSPRVLTEQEILDEIHVAQTYASTRLDA